MLYHSEYYTTASGNRRRHLSVGESPGRGNRPRYDIDQQVELVLRDDAEEYVEDDDEDYDDVSSYSSDDEELSDDYSSIDPGCESYNDVLDQDEAVQHHRAAFYRMYVPMFRSVKTGTHLITNAKYDMLVNLLQLPLPKGATNTERNYRRKYRLGSIVANRCLYRGDKVVTTLERVYDVILEAHTKINHARSIATNKKCINEQLGYYGVPKDAVECFIKTCPKVILVFNVFCQLSVKFTLLPC
jgi:hypothetical protein